MNLRRRQMLQAAAVSGSALLTGCEPGISLLSRQMGQSVPGTLSPPAGPEMDPDFHLLSRAAFGPWPGDLERVKSIGREKWVDEQLQPSEIDDRLCDLRARRFESLFFSAASAYEFKKPVLRDELTRHALLRAIYSRRQLLEVMVEFWTDHLNIDLEKGDCIYLKPSDDRDVIRKHALGRFRDLIGASALSPAMLVYLDGKSNKVRKDTKDVPNENYARELMELHTLGVNGGYTQQDVFEAARCLSGWTFDAKRRFVLNRDKAFFRADWHDDGEKTVLGVKIPAGGGEGDLERLVDIVCQHPSTARYIATKLCRRFVSSEPPKTLVDRTAAVFTRTDGDIRSILREIFLSEEFAASAGSLLKRPFRFMVTALRALAADTHARAKGALVEYLGRMGHGLFQYPTPDGYPDEEVPWMGTLMWRWNFALGLTSGKLSGVEVDLEAVDAALGGRGKDEAAPVKWFAHLVGRAPTPAELNALQTAETQAERLALMLAGPAFQRC